MFRKRLLTAIVAAAVLAAWSAVGFAGPSTPPVIIYSGVHDVSPPLRSIKNVAPGNHHEEKEREILPKFFGHAPGGRDPLLPPGGVQAPAQLGAAPTTPVSFEGEGAGLSGFTNQYIPPDSNGDVGPNHYVQWLNAQYTVFNKTTGAVLAGPTPGNGLWIGFPTTDGNNCKGDNDGDPIVQYDQLADRWVLTQFDLGPSDDGPFFQCVAVSTGPDPTGTYNRYDFQLPYFNDYPKLGVWPDAYYMTFNMFNQNAMSEPFIGGEACALDRTNMIAGNAATAQCFGPNGDPTHDAPFVDLGGGLPIDFDGPYSTQAPPLPPTGEAAIFASYGIDPNDLPNPHNLNNALLVWKFHVDWTTPANSTFTGTGTGTGSEPEYIDVASFTPACPSSNTDSCIPQKGSSASKLDSLSDRLMYRLAYRNNGGTESILVSHSVQPGGSGTGQSGIRWYELRLDGSGNPSLYQQGTFAPADGLSRWLPSIAMDATGNIAVGYSVSSSTTFPSIAIASRAASDTLGTLGGETQFKNNSGVVFGSASQTGTNRWGDYSAMSIDPSDGCTFWYTNEYYTSTGENWRSRIGSFRLPNAAPTISGPSIVCVSDPLTLNAAAGFDSYQWYLGANLISGASTSTYSVASAAAGDAGNYKVVGFTNGCTTLTSTSFSVTVDSPATPAISGVTVVCPGSPLHLTTTAGASSYQWSLGGNPIGGATSASYNVASAGPGDAGDYTVTSTDSNSCTSAASPVFHVTLDTPPAAPAVSGPSSICSGNSLQLSATAGQSSYQWYLDSGSGPAPIAGATGATYTVASAAPSDAGNYTVTATDSFSCTSPSSTSFGVSVVACTVTPQTLTVDAAPNGALSDGDGIFEPGETVIVDPGWNNTASLSDTVTGAASAFTGPAGPTYTIVDSQASYGPIPPATTVDCTSATSNCFALKVTAPATRPTIHWDSTFTETPSGGSSAKTWTLHLGDSFSDVPRSDTFYGFIEAIVHHNVTVGCGNGTAGKGLFCESSTTTREQMAAFIARAILGGDSNVPVSGSGYNCAQVATGQTVPPPPYTSQLADVNPVSDSFCRHINYLYVNGISSGCDGVPDFCETALLNRGQMSAFIARAIVIGGDANIPVSGTGYNCVGGGSSNFTDVPPTDPFCRHINYLFVHGIVAGFGGGIFGENDPVTRGQSAKFLTVGFGLKIYGP